MSENWRCVCKHPTFGFRDVRRSRMSHCVNEKWLGKLQFTLAASLTLCQFLFRKDCWASERQVSKHLAARLEWNCFSSMVISCCRYYLPHTLPTQIPPTLVKNIMCYFFWTFCCKWSLRGWTNTLTGGGGAHALWSPARVVRGHLSGLVTTSHFFPLLKCLCIYHWAKQLTPVELINTNLGL